VPLRKQAEKQVCRTGKSTALIMLGLLRLLKGTGNKSFGRKVIIPAGYRRGYDGAFIRRATGFQRYKYPTSKRFFGFTTQGGQAERGVSKIRVSTRKAGYNRILLPLGSIQSAEDRRAWVPRRGFQEYRWPLSSVLQKSYGISAIRPVQAPSQRPLGPNWKKIPDGWVNPKTGEVREESVYLDNYLNFRHAELVKECIRRRMRRQAMFAHGWFGKMGFKRRVVKALSGISCDEESRNYLRGQNG